MTASQSAVCSSGPAVVAAELQHRDYGKVRGGGGGGGGGGKVSLVELFMMSMRCYGCVNFLSLTILFLFTV